MASCPNCYKPMTTKPYAARVSTAAIEIDACPDCRLFWFDQWESTGLAPQGVLGLFQYIGTATGQSAVPLASRFQCTRCSNPLDFTRDLQRTTVFTYWRCSLGHGRLISFNQFLREKNFIRAPSPAELAQLRATVKQISCSQCGGPIDLAADSACSHCGAPIALIDPDSIAKALHELAASPGGDPAAAAEAARQAMSEAQIDALLDQERVRQRAGSNDLLVIGAQAIGALIGSLLASR